MAEEAFCLKSAPVCCTGPVQVSGVQDERATRRAVDDRPLNQLRADGPAQHRQARPALDQARRGAALSARRLTSAKRTFHISAAACDLSV